MTIVRRHRKLGAEAREEGGEDRDDLPENDRDDDAGDGDDGDRIDHRRLHLALSLTDFSMYCARRCRMVSRIPPASPAATMLVKRSLKIFGCLRIESARLEPDSTSCRIWMSARLKVLFSCWPAEDLEALHERQAGVDHDGELAREDGDELGGDACRRISGGRSPSLSP